MVVFGVLTLFDSIRRNGTGSARALLVGDLANLGRFRRAYGGALLVRRILLPQAPHDPRHNGYARSRH